MTTEANISDPRVSDAYRGIDPETTPPELDETILKMAAGNVPTRYGLSRRWLRPVAWAATIGLSLAFILEISQYTDVPVTRQPAANIVEERVMSDDVAAKLQDEDIASRKLNKRTDAPAKALVPNTGGATPAAMESATLEHEVEADSMGLLQEAEEQMRMRASEAQPAALRAEKKERAQHCDTTARATAESWHACIEDLRDAGLADAARQELDALLIEFPDFREPDLDR